MPQARADASSVLGLSALGVLNSWESRDLASYNCNARDTQLPPSRLYVGTRLLRPVCLREGKHPHRPAGVHRLTTNWTPTPAEKNVTKAAVAHRTPRSACHNTIATEVSERTNSVDTITLDSARTRSGCTSRQEYKANKKSLRCLSFVVEPNKSTPESISKTISGIMVCCLNVII